jgi:hypothetical protein
MCSAHAKRQGVRVASCKLQATSHRDVEAGGLW